MSSWTLTRVHRQKQRQPPLPPAGAFNSSLLAFVYFVIIAAAFSLISSMSHGHKSWSILHQVPDGHVGVYWSGGVLQKNVTDPGFHWKLPLITHYEPVQVTLHTDQVRDIPCVTKEGVMIYFTSIEVVNRLRKDYVYETLLNHGVHYDNAWIYDKIHHGITKFCSSHTLQQVYIDMFDQIEEMMKEAIQGDCAHYAPGIEIISVRVSRPVIPESIRRNFEQMEEERTKVLIAIEKQKVAEMEAETQKKMAIHEAEKNANVSKIMMELKLIERESIRRMQEIENEIYLEQEKMWGCQVSKTWLEWVQLQLVSAYKTVMVWLEHGLRLLISGCKTGLEWGEWVQLQLVSAYKTVMVWLEHGLRLLISGCKTGLEWGKWVQLQLVSAYKTVMVWLEHGLRLLISGCKTGLEWDQWVQLRLVSAYKTVMVWLERRLPYLISDCKTVLEWVQLQLVYAYKSLIVWHARGLCSLISVCKTLLEWVQMFNLNLFPNFRFNVNYGP